MSGLSRLVLLCFFDRYNCLKSLYSIIILYDNELWYDWRRESERERDWLNYLLYIHFSQCVVESVLTQSQCECVCFVSVTWHEKWIGREVSWQFKNGLYQSTQQRASACQALSFLQASCLLPRSQTKERNRLPFATNYRHSVTSCNHTQSVYYTPNLAYAMAHSSIHSSLSLSSLLIHWQHSLIGGTFQALCLLAWRRRWC